MKRYWTCQRQTNGQKCRRVNPARNRKCRACGKPKPARKQPAHMIALTLTYEQYITLNGGERCGICGQEPASRKLDRDHCHTSGRARGLLCVRCNRALPSWITAEWLYAAAAYLDRPGLEVAA